jgi:hypothetical protein
MSSIEVISRPQRLAPVDGQHGPRSGQQVCAHLTEAGRQPQRPQRRQKYLGGEILASARLPTRAKIVRYTRVALS